MDRKPVWIDGRQIFVLPWASVWDVLMALPPADFRAVWTGRAEVSDGRGRTVFPHEGVLSGQKLFIRRTGSDETGPPAKGGALRRAE